MSDEAVADTPVGGAAPADVDPEAQSGSLLDSVETPPAEAPVDEEVNTPEPTPEEAPSPEERPEWLPEKFKTPEDLVQAYNELGAKIREKNEPPEEYDLEMPEQVGDLAEHDVEAFKEMGLTNDQAQKLVDYFAETTLPALMEARTDLELARLSQAWNVEENSEAFQSRLAKVKSWAQQNLPDEAVDHLSRTHHGIQALYTMMQNGASTNAVRGESVGRPDQRELADLMNDERYVNRDPDFMEYVRKKFQEAYD